MPETKNLVLGILKADVVTKDYHFYPKYAVENMYTKLRLDQAIPVARRDVNKGYKDVIYVYKEKELKYDRETGIMTVELPRSVLSIAPSHTAVATVYVVKGHDEFNTKVVKDKVFVIDEFTLEEVSLVKDGNSFPGLDSELK